MEKNGKAIIDEIKVLMGSIYKQIYELENKLGELEASVGLSDTSDAETEEISFDFDGYVQEEKEVKSEEPIEESAPEEVPEIPSFSETVFEAVPVHESVAKGDSGVSVMEALAEKEAWRTDMPGSELSDIKSAISLNDRLLFINNLFHDDPSLFVNTIAALNSMSSLDEAVAYIRDGFPDWDMDSEVVYRFMMAVRRRLR